MSTAVTEGTCLECLGYANCQDICNSKQKYTIPCDASLNTSINKVKNFRLTEIFSGARLFVASKNSSYFLTLGHANNRAGATTFKNINTNVAASIVGIASMYKNPANVFEEDPSGNKTNILYGWACLFIFKSGDQYFGLSSLYTESILIPIDEWPLNTITNWNNGVQVIYPATDEDNRSASENRSWISSARNNNRLVFLGEKFFIRKVSNTEYGEGPLGTYTKDGEWRFISTAYSNDICSSEGNYKSLSELKFNTLTGVMTGTNGYEARRYVLYPLSSETPTTTKVIEPATQQTCSENFYSLWFIAQPSDEENSCEVSGEQNSLTWLWILLGVVGGLIFIGLVVVGFMSFSKKNKKEIDIQSEISLPSQSLPPSNVPSSYPVATVPTAGSTAPFVYSPNNLPAPALAKPVPPSTNYPSPQKPLPPPEPNTAGSGLGNVSGIPDAMLGPENVPFQ